MVLSLFFSVLTLFFYMIPAFILRKMGLANDTFAKILSVVTLYIAQTGMLIHGFVFEYDSKVLSGVCIVFLLACAVHLITYIATFFLFKKTPAEIQKVLRFGIVFSNAGYMGLPVINDVLGPEYAIYVTSYIVAFNIFGFTLGRLIYTGDKKYISVRKAIVNPAVVSILIGLVIYVTGLGGVIQDCLGEPGIINGFVEVIYKVLTALKNMVGPLSMMVIGACLADTEFRGIWRDKHIYAFCFLRLFVVPFGVWLILRPFYGLGFIGETVYSIVLILSSTPAATLTTIFAELYDGNSAYAGKLVALSTLLSVFTMPIVSLLLNV